MTERQSLLQKRRLVAAVLILSLGVSVAANIGHAQDNLPSRLIAAWPPLALLLAIEGVLQIPVDRRWLVGVRLVATGVVAAVAAVLSYGHMRAVAEKYGEGDSAWLWPLSVDGLVVVMSIGLVQLSGLIQAMSVSEQTAADNVTVPAVPEHVAPAVRLSAPVSAADNEPDTVAAMKPREAARYGWRESGLTKPAEVNRWLADKGRADVRPAVYAVQAEFTPPTPELVATNGHHRTEGA